MNLITVKHKGNFKHSESFFNRALRRDYMHILDQYGQKGVDLLKSATPVDSGKTVEAWGYEITKGNGEVSIKWTNSNINQGANVVILLMYGHGLWNGGYVQGNDFVNPAIQPLMTELAKNAWEEVTK